VLLHAAQAELQLGQLAAAEAQLREALSLSEARWGAELRGKQGCRYGRLARPKRLIGRG